MEKTEENRILLGEKKELIKEAAEIASMTGGRRNVPEEEEYREEQR